MGVSRSFWIESELCGKVHCIGISFEFSYKIRSLDSRSNHAHLVYSDNLNNGKRNRFQSSMS